MAVVPYSSDVLCMHKTRLQLLYTDVQQLKKVQMVSPPQLFCVFDLSLWYDYPLAKINCMKFCLNFMQKEGNHIRYFIKYPRRIIEAARPELNCFAVQMVSPPHFFLRFYLFCLMCLSACWKKCAKFYLKFRTERKNFR